MAESRSGLRDVNGNGRNLLLTQRTNHFTNGHHNKIAIVGCTPKSIAIAIAILFKRLACDIILIDSDEEFVKAEAEDINHAAGYFGTSRIIGSKDYSCASDALICIITVESPFLENEKLDDRLEKNLKIFKDVIPNVCKYAPRCILLILSEPVDNMCYIAMRLSGFPSSRVIGLGTFLQSCRLQHLVSQKIDISKNMIQALIIGQDGPHSVPLWSSISVMGIPLRRTNKTIGTKEDPEQWKNLHLEVINNDDNLIKKKGYHSWAVGICVSEIVDAIVRNTGPCFIISTFAQGCVHGLDKDIFTSLPCIIGSNGVEAIVRLPYRQDELKLLNESCQKIFDAQRSILDKFED